MVATLLLPERPSQALHRRQRFVADVDESRLVFPGLPITARWHDDVRTLRVRRPMDAPRIVSAVTAEASQLRVRADLSEQPLGRGGIVLAVIGYFHRAHVQGFGIDGQMDFAPGAAVFGTMLFDFPLALAADFDARAVDQQVQRAGLATHGNLDRQRCPPAAHRAETRYRPVQLQKRQQTADQPSGLPQCASEQDFQRQNGLNGGIGVDLRATFRSAPGTVEPEDVRRRPDRQAAPALQTTVVLGASWLCGSGSCLGSFGQSTNRDASASEGSRAESYATTPVKSIAVIDIFEICEPIYLKR